MRHVRVLLALCALATMLAPSLAQAQGAGTVSGTVSYRQRIALPNNAVVTIQLLDVSRADAAAVVIAEQKLTTNGAQVPIPFSVAYQPTQIQTNGTYAIQATITVDGQRRFINDKQYNVITRGGPTANVAITLLAVPASGRLPNTAGGDSLLLLGFALSALVVAVHLWRRQRLHPALRSVRDLRDLR
jgi:putative lipoprotein